MKKIHLFLLAATAVSFSACKKTNDITATPTYKCATCKTTPDAVAANDASNKGIYKGVMIGSTGTIVFNLANSGTTITALMVIDAVTINLTSTVSIIAGQTYVAPFTGILSGSPVSITFSVGAIGANPTVTTSSIPGHPGSVFSIIKENSAYLLECFEGIYSTTKPETGTFNFMLSRGLKVYSGVSRKDNSTGTGTFDGTINANNELLDNSAQKVFGKLVGDNMVGTFLDSNGSTVTVNSKRTF
jgi:hypothetical protein